MYDDSDKHRFSKLTKISNNLDDCWEWIGTTDRDNSGLFHHSSGRKRAPRAAYEMFYNIKLKNGQRVYHKCNNNLCVNPHHLSLKLRAERFWEKVDIKDKDECWLWKNTTSKDGYGTFWENNTWKRAHRIAYMLTTPDEDITDLLICHKCDIKLCCNPNHLFVGTPLDNMTDKVNKGLQIKGELVTTSKLRNEDIKMIYELLLNKISTLDIIKKFKISKTNLLHIAHGDNWKDEYKKLTDNQKLRIKYNLKHKLNTIKFAKSVS